ncbi:MAG TPA: Fic/DOC family N-terminal domain-containing protein, partial [Myxococcales bacterium]|nr:Fic/DOC family N-terminal domain-containing protein [Myxococcales bacterium]
MARAAGRYERTALAGETVSAFIPDPLPPTSPRLSLGAETNELLRSAEQKLGRLDLAGEMVPSIEWFVYAFVRKEAVVSSQIEGTQATLVDLLAFEASADDRASSDPTDDVREVCNYV